MDNIIDLQAHKKQKAQELLLESLDRFVAEWAKCDVDLTVMEEFRRFLKYRGILD